LFRAIKSAGKYGSLYPTAKCEKVALGKGDTDFSVKMMAQWIETHYPQTNKVAKALEKSSLEQTCAAIHEHLYWYFQYKADQSDQLLRSPACAWKQRYQGIDCKTYSIVASCILLNLGINHYIKKVGYSKPGEYTHVYIIVPVDQVSNDLNDRYYMIDGTIDTMEEPFYIDSKEYLMLSHYGLNQPQLNGIKLDLENLKKLQFNSISNLFASLSCLGGSAYTGELLKKNVEKMTTYVQDNITLMNEALEDKNWNEIGEIATHFGMVRVFEWSHINKRNDGWNACSNRNFDAFIRISNSMYENLNKALMAWIDKYFNKTVVAKVNWVNTGLEAQGYTFMEGNRFKINFPVDQYALTPKTDKIPAFEFTAPLLDAINNNQTVNTEQFLNTLQQFVNVVQPAVVPGSGAGSVDPTTGLPVTPPPSDSGLGIGTIAGIGIGGFILKKLLFS